MDLTWELLFISYFYNYINNIFNNTFYHQKTVSFGINIPESEFYNQDIKSPKIIYLQILFFKE